MSPHTLDHVTFAGADLDGLRDAFEAAGFETTYGGNHSNGITHMALFGFGDRSYVELVSKTDPTRASPWWDEQIDGDAGATAWAVRTDDIGTESARLSAAGFEVDGPDEFSRERPDGEHVEWELTKVGPGPYGGSFPMLIMDHTPLDRRSVVTADAETMGLAGLDTVVVGTGSDAFERYVTGFETLFRTDDPVITDCPELDARLASFDSAPVAVMAPLDGDSWLADRVDDYGTLPCAFLVEATTPAVVRDRYELATTSDWNGGTVHWFDVDVGGKFGAISRA